MPNKKTPVGKSENKPDHPWAIAMLVLGLSLIAFGFGLLSIQVVGLLFGIALTFKAVKKIWIN